MSEELNLRDLTEERWRGHRIEHDLLAVALQVALHDMDRRLTEMNNFREQIRDERAKFVTWPALAAVVMGFIALFGLMVAYYKH